MVSCTVCDSDSSVPCKRIHTRISSQQTQQRSVCKALDQYHGQQAARVFRPWGQDANEQLQAALEGAQGYRHSCLASHRVLFD